MLAPFLNQSTASCLPRFVVPTVKPEFRLPHFALRSSSMKSQTSPRSFAQASKSKRSNLLNRGFAVFCVAVTITPLRADSISTDQAPSASNPSENTRYGLFGLLDHRSSYGQGVFPEPFLVDDSDLEQDEARLDWFHSALANNYSDLVTGEVEKGFGNLTLEVEIPFERDVVDGNVMEGFDNIDVGARYPLAQYVASDGSFDTTVGVGFEAGIPTNSTVSKNAEWVPKLFDDLRVGEHFTLQSIFGYSTLSGGGPDGGLQNFEYGFVLGYTIPHDELPIPAVQQLIPVVEFDGATQVNHAEHGANPVLADVALRANMKTIAGIQPRPGLAFVFPVTADAHRQTHWGVYLSLVFEY
jgi:hypothetical protein